MRFRRPQLDLDAGLELVALLVLTRLDEAQPALAAGEQRRCHLLEVAGDRLERLAEAPLYRLGELVAKLRDLRQRRLEILALGRSSSRRSFSSSYSSFASGFTLPSASRRASSRSARVASSVRSSPSLARRRLPRRAGAVPPRPRRRGVRARPGSRLRARSPRRPAVAPPPRWRQGVAAPRRAGPTVLNRRQRGPGQGPRAARRAAGRGRARHPAHRPRRAGGPACRDRVPSAAARARAGQRRRRARDQRQREPRPRLPRRGRAATSLPRRVAPRGRFVGRKIVEAPTEPGDDHLGRLGPRHGFCRFAG